MGSYSGAVWKLQRFESSCAIADDLCAPYLAVTTIVGGALVVLEAYVMQNALHPAAFLSDIMTSALHSAAVG